MLSQNVSLKSLILKALPAAAFVLLFLIFAYQGKQGSTDRDDAKLKELLQPSSEIPAPLVSAAYPRILVPEAWTLVYTRRIVPRLAMMRSNASIPIRFFPKGGF